MYEEGISLRRKKLEGRRNKVEGRRNKAEEGEGEERWMRKRRRKEGRSIRKQGVAIYLEGTVLWKEGVSAEISVPVYLEERSVCRIECSCLFGRRKSSGRKEFPQNSVFLSTWKEAVSNRVKLSTWKKGVSAEQSEAVHLKEKSVGRIKCRPLPGVKG
jgi:hypothetical protein